MKKKSKKLINFFIALFFSICAIIFLPYYAQITEADDVFVAGLAVIPALVVSVMLCFILIKKNCWALSIVLIVLNSATAILAIYITQDAILKILTFKNKVYDGKVDFTSFQLFLIGIVPALLTLLTWIYMIIKRYGSQKNKKK